VVLLALCSLGILIISCTSSRSSSSSSGAATAAADVLTFHNDVARTGQYLNEVILTTTNVHTPTFGKVSFFTVDGKVDAQPLYLSNVNIPNQGVHSVLYVATEHGSVFAFDAASGQSCGMFPCSEPGRARATLEDAMKR
jgi:hypothetical protein